MTEKKEHHINLPVKPQVLQFLIYHFGPHYKMSFRDFLGPYLFSILQNKIDHTWKKIDKTEFSQKYTIVTTDWFLYDLGVNSFSDYKVHLFNRFIIELFNDRMVDYVASMERIGINNKEAILKWCERYDLDAGSEDWYQICKKNYYRHRKKYRKSTCKVSPAISKQKHTLAQ